ncbi:MAG: hypothetical protein ACKVE4_07305 [Dissulfuribacterales bacterium]
MQKKIFSVLVQVVIVISAMGFLTVVNADESAPLALVEGVSYDFGTVLEGSNVLHDFVIKNKGDADLEIVKVKSG